MAKQIGSLNIKNVNADAQIQGNVAMTSRPVLAANWRIEPNLTAQVNLGDTNLSVAGVRVNVPAQLKPTIDKAVNDQLATLQQRIRNDPLIEQNARREWAQMCRSIPLQGATAPPPHLWLELRPIKAVAAQPRIDADAMTLTLGINAQLGQYTSDYHLIAAASMIAAIPVFVVYLVLQRQFERGVAEGALKS